MPVVRVCIALLCNQCVSAMREQLIAGSGRAIAPTCKAACVPFESAGYAAERRRPWCWKRCRGGFLW